MQRYRPLLGAATTLLIGVALSGAMATAQEATPSATEVTEGPVSLPTHIHSGTCDQLGDIVFPLGNVGLPASSHGTPVAGGTVATPAADQSMTGSPDALPVYVSVTQLESSLDEILKGDHAINVHASEQQIDRYVACGNVGGTRYGDTVQFGLSTLNNSGYSGVALLSANGNGSTNVVVYLTKAKSAS